MLAAHRRGALVALRTSGTSAGPRSVVRTTESWFASFPAVSRLTGIGPGARVWLPGPLTTTMNLFAAVHAADVGAEVVSGPGATGPGGASHAVLTPAVLARVLARGDALGGVGLVVAGDRLARGLRDRALAAGAARVGHYYGAAELSFVAWGSHDGDLEPFPGVEVDVRDGSVWARSPYLCEGYVGPDGPLRRDAAGFATVGDRGWWDGRTLRLTGRGDAAVTTAGVTVPVEEVEGVLAEAAGHDVRLVGTPHPDLGAVLCGVVTSRTALEPVAAAARSLPEAAQRPRRWFVLPEPPLTPAGKVDRPALARAVQDLRPVVPRRPAVPS